MQLTPREKDKLLIAMAANVEGSNLQHVGALNVAHLMFAGMEAKWADKLGTSWFSTHPPLLARINRLRQLRGMPPVASTAEELAAPS